MKQIIIIAAAIALAVTGCRNQSDNNVKTELTAEITNQKSSEKTTQESKEKASLESAGKSTQESTEKGESEHEGEIVLSERKQKTFGIQTEKAVPGGFSEVIHTSGRIVSANGDEMTIVAKGQGTVNIGSIVEGSPVGEGRVVATISSKGIGSGDQLAKAKIAFETAKKEYDRDIELKKDNIVSESHLDQSRLAYEQTKADYEALSSGGSSSEGVNVIAPLTGFIKSLQVKQGDYVETGQTIATVSRNKRLQLRADIPERHFGMIGRVNDANFQTASSERVYNLKELNGRLLTYGKASEGDGFIPVTFEFDNIGDLYGGSIADVYLKTSSEEKTFSVPVSSILEDQGVHYVFIQIEPDAFLKREVKTGESDGQRTRILSGLEDGDEVVVSGALQVKLASVTAVPAGHTHSH